MGSATTGSGGPRVTSRAMVLLVVLAVLVVSYASSLKAFVQQRAHVEELHAQIAASEAAIAKLEREQRRWDDDAFVETQARERFGWVMPGEVAYQVVDADGNPLEKRDRLTDPDTVATSVPEPWWTSVAGSFAAADHPEDVSTPAEKLTAPVQSDEAGD